MAGKYYEIDKLMALWDAVDDEAVTTFTLNSELSPKEQLHKIIEWHIQVATDPAVNGGNHLTPYPADMVGELLALLDRIEVEDDHTLASQRMDIAEKYGFDVVIDGPASGAQH